MKKRCFAALMVVIMCITTLLPTNVSIHAEEMETELEFVEFKNNDMESKEIVLEGAVLSEIQTSGTVGDNSGFQWIYDVETKTLTVTGEDSVLYGSQQQKSPFSVINLEINKIIFEDCKFIGSISCLCKHLTNLTDVKFVNCDMSEVTDMSRMFYHCNNLSSIDLSGLDTGNVTDMSAMFYHCDNLSSINLGGLATRNVTDMSYMFYYCGNLGSIDVDNWNTGNVTDMSYMFSYCSNLSSINVSGWNTGNVTDMSYMFSYCSNLSSINVSGWNTGNVTDMSQMFSYCRSLSGIDVGNWDIENVMYMCHMFCYCSSLSSIDIQNWNMRNVKDMYWMFERCKSLDIIYTPIILSEWDVISLPDTFYDTQMNPVTRVTSEHRNKILVKNREQDTIDSKIYTSDIFYGYSKILQSKAFLLQPQMLETVAAVQSEYIESPEFKVTIILSGDIKITSPTEAAWYFMDNCSRENFRYSEQLDAANASFIQAMCDNKSTVFDDAEVIMDFLSSAKIIADWAKEVEKKALDSECYKKNGKSVETYADFTDWMFAYLKDYLTYIDPNDFETLRTKYYTYYSTLSSSFEFTHDAIHFVKGLGTALIMHDCQMAIVKDILKYQDSTTLLYKGMSRYYKQLERGLLINYGIETIYEQIDKFLTCCDEIIVAILAGTTTNVVVAVQGGIQLVCKAIMKINGYHSYDEYIVSTILCEYARNMYSYMEKKAVEFDGCFLNEEIIKYQKAYEYCLAASKLALSESRKFAKFNKQYDQDFVDETIRLFDEESFEKYIERIKDYLMNADDISRWEVEATTETYVIKENNYELALPSDNIEANRIYISNNKIFGNIRLVDSVIGIPEDWTLCVLGDLLVEKNSEFYNEGCLSVANKLECSSNLFKNSGTMQISGNLKLRNTEFCNSGEILVEGNASVTNTDVTNQKKIQINGDLSTAEDSSEIFSSHYYDFKNENAELKVQGNAIIKYCTNIICSNNSIMRVGGNIELKPGSGVTASRDCSITLDNSQLYCDGDIVEGCKDYSSGKLKLLNDAKFFIKGNILFQTGGHYSFEEGTIILEGNDVQELQGIGIYNLEVHNNAGIQLNENLRVYGNLLMNGNPIQDNGNRLLLYEGARLSDDIIYPEIEAIEIENLDYNISCNNIYFTNIHYPDKKTFTIAEDVVLTVYNCFYTKEMYPIIVNNGSVNILEDMNLRYSSKYYNYGQTTTNNLNINYDNGEGVIGSAGTCFYNYNLTNVKENVLLRNAGEIYMVDPSATLFIGGDLKRESNARKYDLQIGYVVLNGKGIQTIDNVEKFGYLEILNDSEEGVVFTKGIKVYTLFNHNRNKYSLANDGNDSTFVDFDGDGMLDHVDDYPMIKWKELKFSGASLTLYDNLTINYKVSKAFFEENGYENPYVKFVFNGEEKIVDKYTIVDDKYVFDFSDIAPNQMSDTISATLYAEFNGIEFASETKEYSVATYCYSMLEKCSADEYAEFRTLLVDLLNYGEKSQIYTDYNIDDLVMRALTAEQKAWGTSVVPEFTSVMDKEYAVIDNPTVIWKGAGLNLQDSVTIRFKIAAESIDGLTIKVTTANKTWKIPSSEFKTTDGGYYIYFDGLNAGQMREPIYLTVYDGETAVSNTVCYSIESYAYSKKDDADEKLVDLINAMMKYGDSAYSYIN